jgi:hypothetical protein
MIWNLSAFEPAISDRNIHLNDFDNPLSAPPPVVYSLLSFLPSLLPDDLLHWASSYRSSDYSLFTTCVLRWLPVLDVIQSFHGKARGAARHIMREEILKS